MKSTITDKQEEAYTDNDGFIVLPSFFPRLGYKNSVNKCIGESIYTPGLQCL